MIRREKNRKKRKLWQICLSLLLFCPLMTGEVRAEDKETEGKSEAEIVETIKNYRDSIVHIESKCWDGKETVYESRAFSGFVVSQDSGGIYIATVCNGLTYTSEEKQKIEEEYTTEESSNNKINITEQIEAVFNGDLRVQASIVGESRQRNLTILRLDQTVSFENVPVFAENEVLSGSRAFLLSYPKMKSEEKAVYNIDNVKITEGSIADTYQKNEITFFRHNMKADECSLGGPILNEDGAITGLFLKAKGKNAGTALSGKEIQAFLDTFNISYETYQEEVPEKKFSIYHKILGCVILILFAAVILQRRKGNGNPEEKTKGRKKDRYSAKTVKEESLAENKKKKGKDKAGKKSEDRISAKLEYPAEKRVMTMHKAMFVIGRAKEADFILAESQGISRKHACIQFDGKYFYVSDLNSTNHTFLNGTELRPGEKRVLKDGDEIMVARERLIFRKGV